jgi:hypothetical protein
MSSTRNTNYTHNTAAAVTTPYCKVCYDAGKSKSEYTSHFVKDQPGPQGKIICPTLLNQACRICHKPGHTSSYCPQYKSRRDYREEPRREEPRREEPRREEPRREERYIPRDEQPRREERYIPREEPRREERYIPREEQPRREERYIPREEQPRREERYIDREPPRRREERDISFNLLREDTERREREIQKRDEAYHREQDRLAKPWLQAALKSSPSASSQPQQQQQQQERHQPYAHPHGPRIRLEIEAPALCASKHAAAAEEKQEEDAPKFDILAAKLNPTEKWGDEDNEQQPFVYNPEEMSREFLQQCIMSGLTTNEEYELIAACDDQSQMPFFCGQ